MININEIFIELITKKPELFNGFITKIDKNKVYTLLGYFDDKEVLKAVNKAIKEGKITYKGK